MGPGARPSSCAGPREDHRQRGALREGRPHAGVLRPDREPTVREEGPEKGHTEHELLGERTRQPPCSGARAPPAAASPVVVDDEADGLEEHGVPGVGVLHLLRLGRLLGLVQHRLQALGQAASHGRVFWAGQKAMGPGQPRSPPPPPGRTPGVTASRRLAGDSAEGHGQGTFQRDAHDTSARTWVV